MAASLHTTLMALLADSFHIIPAPGQRADQQYKRFLQSWKKWDAAPGREMEIMAARKSRDVWAPRLRAFAHTMADTIRVAAEAERNAAGGSLREKVFDDAIFDDVPGGFSLVDDRVSPAAQQLAWWQGPTLKESKAMFREFDEKKNRPPPMTSHKATPSFEKAVAVRLLLDKRRAASVLYLAHTPSVNIKDLFAITFIHDRYYAPEARYYGWGGLLDDALQVWMCTAAATAFPSLVRPDNHMHWLPHIVGQRENTSAYRLLTLEGTKTCKDHAHVENLQQYALQCLHTMAVCEVLMDACGIEGKSRDWASRIEDAFLLFVGFEAWNREREGQGYLGCNLNKKKDSTWLNGWGGSAAHETIEHKSTPKKQNILEMGGHNREESEEEEEDPERAEKLAALEREEALYGARRSFKYQRRQGRLEDNA